MIMKRISLYLLSLLLVLSIGSRQHSIDALSSDAVNSIIGDTSFIKQYGEAPDRRRTRRSAFGPIWPM